ncbi:MAG TPA: S46 family peptidase [Thermoanaerobaculia bacterium]|nr:S46 family peptidase [Thermoanaerobaculia bacterium]
MKTFVTIIALLAALPLHAVEGKWTPQQVLQLDAAWLKKQGLQLPPSRLWDGDRGTGLLAATINTGGCSGGFISAEGLFITNHHCLFGVLQEHATPENDIITNGFLARTKETELRSRTLRITIPHRFTDVTKEVLAAVPNGASDAERHRAIARKQEELVAACEKQAARRCLVAAHDGGVQYVLQETIELSDIRLVYAPPRAVGEYGGEVDNWMWPRHTGDFAIGRVYGADGKPYHPEFFFPISTAGAKKDDFVMVLGYPGITYRSLTANEMAERHLYFTRRATLYREWIDLLEANARGNAAAEIAVADNVKTLANRQKNAEGQLAGFKRGDILGKRRAADDAVLAFAKKNEAHRGALAAYDELAAMAKEQSTSFDRDFLLTHINVLPASLGQMGPKSLIFAATIARAANARAAAENEREPLFAARTIGRVRERMEREQKNYYEPADKALLASFVKHAKELPEGQHIAALDSITNIDQLYASTKLLDVNERMKMFDETAEQLHARHDPLVELGFALAGELRALNEKRDRWDGAISRLRPEWRRAVIAHAGKPVAPDANSTLRVSFAHVQGYEPRDGVFYTPFTTLGGAVDKHTNEEPFDMPDALLAAAKGHEETPLDFLADADTTGGNSGSPVVNGKGELVGVNFDRVWENVANDFGYMPDVNRNISVDVRYLLWMLRNVDHATELLKELGTK